MKSNYILSLLQHLKQCWQQQHFIDFDSDLTEAIKKNEPDTESKITNCFFKTALGHISKFNSSIGQYLQSDALHYLCNSYSQFTSVVNKDSQDFFNDDHGILNSKKGLGWHEKIVITLQLTIWSCVSFKCFKCICIAVTQFKRNNIDIGESEFWLWLHCFTTCVLCSTSCVYDMYATALEKNILLARCYCYPLPLNIFLVKLGNMRYHLCLRPVLTLIIWELQHPNLPFMFRRRGKKLLSHC